MLKILSSSVLFSAIEKARQIHYSVRPIKLFLRSGPTARLERSPGKTESESATSNNPKEMLHELGERTLVTRSLIGQTESAVNIKPGFVASNFKEQYPTSNNDVHYSTLTPYIVTSMWCICCGSSYQYTSVLKQRFPRSQ
jgi:hypothetical protein